MPEKISADNDDVAGLRACRFAELAVHFEPMASLAVWLERRSKGEAIQVPSTDVMLREGSFPLALFGSFRKVQATAFDSFGRKSVAVKRIVAAIEGRPFCVVGFMAPLFASQHNNEQRARHG